MRLAILAVAAILGGFFTFYDREAAQDQERARIAAEMAKTDYQQTYARQLERWAW